jgi:hypothetical protein
VRFDHGGPIAERPPLWVMKFTGDAYRMKPSAAAAGGASGAPALPPRPCPGSCNLSIVGCSLVMTYKYPLVGFTATMPQLAPPL